MFTEPSTLNPVIGKNLPKHVVHFGSFPHPVTVLKGGLIKGLLEFLLPLVVTVTVRGNNPRYIVIIGTFSIQ